MLSGRPLALVILAWSWLKVLLKALFTRRRSGLERFRDNYGAEGLEALEPGDRERIERFSGCIACGRCDLGEAERIAASRGEYPGLMQLVLASTRSMPEYDAAARAFGHVPERVLQSKTASCPTRIPFADLAAFVRSKAAWRGRRSEPGEEAVAEEAALPTSVTASGDGSC